MFEIQSRSRAFEVRRENGAALVIGLIFLVVLSLSLLMSFRGSILQERMAGGFRNESLAEAAAESALRAGENWVWDTIVANLGAPIGPGSASFVRGPASIDSQARLFRETVGWTNLGQAYADGVINTNADGQLANAPRFIIEALGEGARPGGGGASGLLVTHIGGYSGSGGGGGALGLVDYYRVTARGSGGTEGVVRVVESTYTVTR